MVYKLRLPKAWRIHDVFHASLLTPQVTTPEYGIPDKPPLLELVDGESEFEVENILQHKFVGRKKEFIISSSGADIPEQSPHGNLKSI